MKNEEIELSIIPNDRYRKFFDKFAEINILPVEQWKPPQLIGYFAKKYKDYYHTDYQWKFNSPSPSKCFEVFQLNTLCSKLSSKPTILKEYIDWCFVNVVPKAKRKLTSISFITKEDAVIFYKLNVLLAGQGNNNTIDRSTLLPNNYKDILQSIGSINTYGDLAFLSQINPMPDNIVSAFDQLTKLGLDKSILSRII